MLRSHDGVDDRGEIIDIRKGFYAENDIVEGALLLMSGIFWRSNNWRDSSVPRIDGDEPAGRLTMARLEALVAKRRRPDDRVRTSSARCARLLLT